MSARICGLRFSVHSRGLARSLAATASSFQFARSTVFAAVRPLATQAGVAAATLRNSYSGGDVENPHAAQSRPPRTAMPAQIIDGSAIAKGIRQKLNGEIAERQRTNPRYKPSLVIIQGMSTPYHHPVTHRAPLLIVHHSWRPTRLKHIYSHEREGSYRSQYLVQD